MTFPTPESDGWERDCLSYDPMEGGKGDSGVERVLSDEMRTCRKARPCMCCFEQTAPGSRIRTQTAKVDGRMASVTFCELCCRAMAEVRKGNFDEIERRTTIGMRNARTPAVPPKEDKG